MGKDLDMRAVAMLLLLLFMCFARTSRATEIDGKWGMGIAVGSLFSSGAEASLIRGKNAGTAWIADFAVNVVRDDRNAVTHYHPPYYSDTTIVGKVAYEFISVETGPRLRRFTRPA